VSIAEVVTTISNSKLTVFEEKRSEYDHFMIINNSILHKVEPTKAKENNITRKWLQIATLSFHFHVKLQIMKHW